MSPKQLRDLKSKKYLQKHMERTRVLVIDEISMLHARQLDLVNRVIRSFKENEEPFGGIQLVLCGDFFQLPPIGEAQESSRDKFSFMASSWLEANLSICYLTEQFRQSDSQFSDLLNEIRSGHVSRASIELLNSRRTVDADPNESTESQKDLTRLYTHNLDVDRVNQDHLKKIKGRIRSFDARIKGNMKLAETIQRSIMAPPVLELKKGARVMFVKNNYEKGYLNGSLGEILSFDKDGQPVVRLTTGAELKAEPEEWRVEDETGKLLVGYTQVPLRLAWAITVHKSQGMTLDAALMDLGRTFERGQGYVALSRVKIWEARGWSISTKRQIKKKTTYLITKQLIDKGHSLEEIAIQRDLTTGTLCTHLLKIASMYPNTDLSRFKPDRSTMAKVRNARKKVMKNGKHGETVSLKPIFDALKGDLSYDQIKVALLFV